MKNVCLRLLAFFALIAPTKQLTAADVFAARAKVNRHEAFTHVTGMTEDEFNRNLDANTARILNRNAAGQHWVKNVVTNGEWYAGKFETASIQELRAAIDARPCPVARGGKRRRIAPTGTFSVLAGFTPANLTPAQQRRCNVTALQADPANMGAVFQVASNFHALEGAGAMTCSRTGGTCCRLSDARHNCTTLRPCRH